MKTFPVPDPGEPDCASAGRYLWWLARVHAATLAAGMAMGILWMVAQALMPAAVGAAIDALSRRDNAALRTATLVLLGLGVTQTVAGLMRHRFAVTNWLGSAYRTVQVTVRQATRLGATLPRRVVTGEVVSIGTADIEHLGNAMDVVARAAGAVVAIIVVGVVLLGTSVPLGLVVIVGVPVLVGLVGLLLRPLHRRQQYHRELSGELTNRAADIVSGLRVLRGVGGEAAFAGRYRAESQQVRDAGVRVAKVDSYLEAAQVLLPGVFIALVTWLGARFALSGAITAGELVAFYGYAAFLVFPLRTLTEAADKLTKGHVAARRVVELLALRPEVADPADPAPPPRRHNLTDPDSGVVVEEGSYTAIAAALPTDAALIADRLGRYLPDSGARLDGVPLADLAVAAVRDRILVADNDARLFGGRLRDQLAPDGRNLSAAIDAASAQDIIDALPDGLETEVAQRGREFSGGQQQRLRLVRALVADPPVLILVEPTSAVDAHTEARIAERLRAVRSGRTTVVCTTSPLLLDAADTVLYVERGRVVAAGPHRALLTAEPRYAATVTRGEDT
ncbi:MAG TPA: ABC transporter ATP-binding protein [Micromonosporaceae bacterium]|nr:ABC transporter ATP-binding protein [Micromonosporaceae bacterium]